MNRIECVPPEDFAAILTYLDGDLEGLELFSFEDRLSTDAELAEAFELISRLDEVQRIAARRRREHDWRRTWLRGPALAAAILAALGLLRWIVVSWTGWMGEDPSAGRVALIENGQDLSAFAEVFNGDPTLLRDPLRGPEDPPLAQEVIEHAGELERAALSAALDTERHQLELQNGYYKIGVRPRVDSFAIVVQVPSNAEGSRVYPVPGDVPAGEPLEGGVEHLLPSLSVVPVQIAGVELYSYRGGFSIRRTTAEATTLVGLRRSPPSSRALDDLDTLLRELGPTDASRAERLRAWLESEGFEVQGFELRHGG